MKKITLGLIALFSLVMLSTAILASISTMQWQSPFSLGSTASIYKGNTATFDVSVDSFNPGAVYTIDVFDNDWNFVSNLRSGTIDSTSHYSERITLTPADYGNIGGTFHIRTYTTEGSGMNLEEDISSLDLVVSNEAPWVYDIPDLSLEAGSSYTLDLNDYVWDSDDFTSDIAWSVSGNWNVEVYIDSDNIATIVAPTDWTGSETLTFTATDPSGDSSFDDATVTVYAQGTNPSSKNRKATATVKSICVEYSGENLVAIRNSGMNLEDVTLKVSMEAPNAPLNMYHFSIDSGSVIYRVLDTEGMAPGQYLAKVDLSSYDSDDDSSATGYMLVEI